jgi:D-aspartate ligase
VKHQPAAVVMNMFYTGLGIARSLGEQGIRVIGLSAGRAVPGRFTRYAERVIAPDSRKAPEALMEFLLDLRHKAGEGAVLFPTRDDDVAFLDRYRERLEPHYRLVLPPRQAVATSLNKWETYCAAKRAGVPVPATWLIRSEADLAQAMQQVAYPCVLKPMESRDWRQGDNWAIVGARKAIGVASKDELWEIYRTVARADVTAIVQELIPGSDDCLAVVACYVDAAGKTAATFQARKLMQSPPGFGTGCIVGSARYPELVPVTERLLASIGYRGIAEVEYKWDVRKSEFTLIEINPRPWDQHRLGRACGVDLMHTAYRDYTGAGSTGGSSTGWQECRWIGEDAVLLELLRRLWRRERSVGDLVGQLRGPRIMALWSARDPLPALIYFVTGLVPTLAAGLGGAARSKLRRIIAGGRSQARKELVSDV